jgi:biopolymer transport protein ExbB/TolQ
VATFWGLLVAIPALAAHGIFRNRLEAIAAEAANETEKLLLDIKRNSQMQNQPLTISPNLQASA